MKRFFALVALLITTLSLTSCISYTSKSFTPPAPSVISTARAQKAYIDELSLSNHAATWVSLDKQKKSGKKLSTSNLNDFMKYRASLDDCQEIAKYITTQHPEIFTNKKEGAILVRLEIDGQEHNIGHSTLMAMLCGMTFWIVPAGIYDKQSINVIAETLEDSPKKGSQTCVLEVNHKWGGAYSPFVWAGASSAHAKEFYVGITPSGDIWHNFFLTPEFADYAAAAVNNVLQQK